MQAAPQHPSALAPLDAPLLRPPAAVVWNRCDIHELRQAQACRAEALHCVLLVVPDAFHLDGGRAVAKLHGSLGQLLCCSFRSHGQAFAGIAVTHAARRCPCEYPARGVSEGQDHVAGCIVDVNDAMQT